MGNQFSLIVSEFVMRRFESDLDARGLLPKNYIRFVDDSLMTMKKSGVPETLRIFNSIYPTIKFTVEEEVNRCLPFLDLLLTRMGPKST